MKPKPTFRTLILTALIMVGLCFGNLLHQVVSHTATSHSKESPLSCWVCATNQHAFGNLGSESDVVAAPSTNSTDVPPAHLAPCLPAEHSLSSPRSPPYSA